MSASSARTSSKWASTGMPAPSTPTAITACIRAAPPAKASSGTRSWTFSAPIGPISDRPTMKTSRTSSAPGTAGNTSSRPANARRIRACGCGATRCFSAKEASMSTSDALDWPAETLTQAAAALAAAVSNPDSVPDAELREVIASAVKLYAAKAENGMRTPLPPGGAGLTVTDAMLVTTDLLHALNVQMFELSMWQAMTGNCIAPHQRVDAPQT